VLLPLLACLPACHWVQVKVKAAQKFLGKGHRIKLSLQFRGREMEFQQIGREMFEVRGGGWVQLWLAGWLMPYGRVAQWPSGPCHIQQTNPFTPPLCLPAFLQRFVEDCGEDVSVEQAPQMQGRQMNMVLGPKKIQLV
jgi:translation initiation factor IF-3